MSRTFAEQVTLAVIPKVTATLSLLGSSWIVVEISTHNDKGHNVYHRLLFGMSIYDILESIWNFCSTWPIPRGTEGIYGAAGTTQTCVAQGFFLQLGLAVPIYNVFLSIFYLLVIRYSWTEQRIAQRVEPMFHLVAFGFSFATAVAAIVLDLYNNANLWCWIAPLPEDCLDSWRHGDDNELPCERGDNAWIYRWAFYFAPLWFCVFVAMLAILLVYHAVLKREAATVRYRHASAVAASAAAGLSHCAVATTNGTSGVEQRSNVTSHVGQSTTRRQNHRLSRQISAAFGNRFNRQASEATTANPRSREVLEQAVWYVGAFYLTHTFSTVNRVLQQVQGDTYFPLIVLHSFFDPFQGALNFIVYRRPRYLRYRKRHPDESKWSAIRSTLRFTFQERQRQEEQHRLAVAAQIASYGYSSNSIVQRESGRSLAAGHDDDDDELEMMGFGRQQSRRSGMLLLLECREEDDESASSSRKSDKMEKMGTEMDAGEDDDEEDVLNRRRVHFSERQTLEEDVGSFRRIETQNLQQQERDEPIHQEPGPCSERNIDGLEEGRRDNAMGTPPAGTEGVDVATAPFNETRYSAIDQRTSKCDNMNDEKTGASNEAISTEGETPQKTKDTASTESMDTTDREN